MSLEQHLKPFLTSYPIDNGEWYLKATTDALNAYMQQLEISLSIPNMMITGTSTMGAVVTPIAGPLAYFVPTVQRFTMEEVKTAMWCGNPEMSFKNLFNLFGEKFALNFILLQASPVLLVNGYCTMSINSFGLQADNLMAEVKSFGQAMNSDIFVGLESTYLSMAIASIPPISVPLLGSAIIPPGMWTGTSTVNFMNVAYI